MPASIASATRAAWASSVVKTYDPRPNGVPFAISIACSSPPTR
jgi:hypothetical protein